MSEGAQLNKENAYESVGANSKRSLKWMCKNASSSQKAFYHITNKRASFCNH